MSVCHPNNKSKAWWKSQEQRGELIFTKGNYATGMGYNVKGKTFLYPEEVLFLVDRGALDIYFPPENDLDEDKINNRETLSNFNPISFPFIFSLILSCDIDLIPYQVYSHLKRLGYIVRRTEAFFSTQKDIFENHSSKFERLKMNNASPHSLAYIFAKNFKTLNTQFSLAIASECKTYDSIFEKIRIISEASDLETTKDYMKIGRYRPQFEIWQPSSKFKRSNPGPGFRLITVVRMSDPPPQAQDLIALSSTSIPVTIAMVDEGNISFVDLRPGKISSF